MKITLRQKQLSAGRVSLYLDIYQPLNAKKRYKEYLKLYIFSSPKDKKEKGINKETLLLAESIAAKRLLELQGAIYGFKKEKVQSINFITYFKEQAEKKTNLKTYSSWTSVLNHLIIFSSTHVPFKDIDESWLENFKNYLLKEARKSNKSPLSKNTSHHYYSLLRACLKQAYREKIISYNPSDNIKSIKKTEIQREFLTLEELQLLAKTECYVPLLKTAFLFSTLTGLRWSDISKLTWEEIQHSEALGYYLRFTQTKTKGVETQPISEQAFNLLGEREEPRTRVFKGLNYGAWNNLKLSQWVLKAGIPKNITFHCARHTYATLQLTLGTDIYTVSKLLGHKDIKTTQIYANIVNEKKVEAANKIPNIF